jgi:hypothetical protein
MTQDPKSMTCHEFQAQLPDLIGSCENLADHPHLRQCPLCHALLMDLKTIAEAAHELLPIVEPPDDVWKHIESAIQSEENTFELEKNRE